MQTITVKLLTADEAVLTLKNLWSSTTPEAKAGEELPETLVFIADKTSKAEIKKAVSEAVSEQIDAILELKRVTELPVEVPVVEEKK
jgi:hypothetical protein